MNCIMKYSVHILMVGMLCLFVSCSGNDEPRDDSGEDTMGSEVMRIAAVTTDYKNGGDEMIQYDDYGRVCQWSCKYRNGDYVVAKYSYPNANTIEVGTEEQYGWNGARTEETIHMKNGRAVRSEGLVARYSDSKMEFRQLYRVDFGYDGDDHLVSVTNSQVNWFGEDFDEDEWNHAWVWENNYVWNNGNLSEYQHRKENAGVHTTRRYKYLETGADGRELTGTPSILLKHHSVLMGQGVFGRQSECLVSECSDYDRNGNVTEVYKYSYDIENNRIISFYQEWSNDEYHVSLTRMITWESGTKNSF